MYSVLACIFIASLFNPDNLAVADMLQLHSYGEQWQEFKIRYGKVFNNTNEEAERFGVFVANVKMIEAHNAQAADGTVLFTMGINEFTDIGHTEFVRSMNGYKGKSRTDGAKFLPPAYLQEPEAVDWRDADLVTPIKNQGQCGSCWAFSTTGSLEGQLARKTGKLVSLSEQNLLDCSRKNYGCGGGFVDAAFAYIRDNKGIDTEESYPYIAKRRRCHYSAAHSGGKDTGFVDVDSGDEDALLSAVASVGPISVAIDASHRSFQNYKSGVYFESACSSKNLDHAVLVVGYGSHDGQDYWLVKNSWDTSWGEEGYIKMARNRNNNCGIATSASYPTV